MRVKCEARVDSSFTPGHKVNVFIYQNPDLIASPSSGPDIAATWRCYQVPRLSSFSASKERKLGNNGGFPL